MFLIFQATVLTLSISLNFSCPGNALQQRVYFNRTRFDGSGMAKNRCGGGEASCLQIEWFCPLRSFFAQITASPQSAALCRYCCQKNLSARARKNDSRSGPKSQSLFQNF